MNPWHPYPILTLVQAQQTPGRRYLRELLIQEGYFCTEHIEMDPDQDVADHLAGRALVMVSADTLTARACEQIAQYVHAGGACILLAPPSPLLEALGLGLDLSKNRGYNRSGRCYAHFLETNPARQHAGAVVQCLASAALSHIQGEVPWVMAAGRKDEASTFPLVSVSDMGSGRVVLFRFDPGTNNVLLRQGDARLATTAPLGDPTDLSGYKPAALFAGVLDPELRDVPQADVWADLLVAAIRQLTDDRLPLPRVWQFPNDTPALTLLDGDSDMYDWDSYHKIADPALAGGVPYTLNLIAKHLREIDRGIADRLMAQGHDFQLHHYSDSNTPSVELTQHTLAEQVALFESTLGCPTVAGRGHALLWPGYTDVAEAYSENGLRMETNFMPFRGCQYGYFGSARAARYMTLDGRLLAVSQQPTALMDDPMSNEKSLLPARTSDEAYAIATRLYEQSVHRFHGGICTCLHPVMHRVIRASYLQVQNALCHAVVDATARWGLTALSQRDWSGFHEARRQLDLCWYGDGWRLTAGEALKGCTIYQPAETGSLRQGGHWRATVRDLEQGQSISLPQGVADQAVT